jgi:hypothetical protein
MNWFEIFPTVFQVGIPKFKMDFYFPKYSTTPVGGGILEKSIARTEKIISKHKVLLCD